MPDPPMHRLVTEPAYVAEIRTSYDTVAEAYAPLVREAFDQAPVERALLVDLARQLRGRVLDAGCGPGHVTAFLAGLGVDAFGLDLSPGMIDVARRSHPGLEFAVGSMTALDLPDDSLGGVVQQWRPEDLAALLEQAGFAVARRSVSDDSVPQAVLGAQKPSDESTGLISRR